MEASSYEEFNPIIDAFAGELRAAIRFDEEDTDDWHSTSPEYLLACAESALIRLRAAVKTGDRELVRDNSVDLALSAMKLAVVEGRL